MTRMAVAASLRIESPGTRGHDVRTGRVAMYGAGRRVRHAARCTRSRPAVAGRTQQDENSALEEVVVTGFRAQPRGGARHQARRHRRGRCHRRRGHRQLSRPEPRRIHPAHSRRLDRARRRRGPPDHRARPRPAVHARAPQRHGGDDRQRRHGRGRRHQPRPRLRLQHLRLRAVQRHHRAQDRLGRMEEGSLGATVDLRTGAPVRLPAASRSWRSGRAVQRPARRRRSARRDAASATPSPMATFGALLSVAYTDRKLIDEGSSTVRWGRQRRRRLRQARAGYAGTRHAGQLNAAFVPRIPRYDYYEHEQERLGSPARCSGQPSDATLVQPRSRCTRSSTPSAARSSSRRRTSAPASAACSVAGRGHRREQHRWSTACSTTSTSAPRTASTSCPPSSRR